MKATGKLFDVTRRCSHGVSTARGNRPRKKDRVSSRGVVRDDARNGVARFPKTKSAQQPLLRGELDRVRFAALNAERAWIDPERIANAWAPERLLAWALDKARATVT